MQYCVSCSRVIEYCAKYATKCELHSQTLQDVFTTIVNGVSEEERCMRTLQKLLISSTAGRDYSAQETCHILLLHSMFLSSRSFFVVLSIDGLRLVEEHLDEDKPATALSLLDHYRGRLSTAQFESMTLLHFVQHYSLPKCGNEPSLRSKAVAVILHSYVPPDTNEPKYEQYCLQKLMINKPFRQIHELQAGFDNYVTAFNHFLLSGIFSSRLVEDVRCLQQDIDLQDLDDRENDEQESMNRVTCQADDWMLICKDICKALRMSEDLVATSTNWLAAARQYPNLEEV